MAHYKQRSNAAIGRRIIESVAEQPENKKWPDATRAEYFKAHPENFAGKDMSYPIEDADDVRNAAQALGRAKPDERDAIKANIIAIAKRLKLDDALPDDWLDGGADDDDDKEGDKEGRATEAVATIHVESHILEGQSLDRKGHDVRVTVIKGGKSKNGYVYDAPALQEIARLIEGAKAYADHDVSVPVRSLRDMVGFYKNATYMAPDATNPDGRVDATLHILEAAEWLWSIIYEAVSQGLPDLVGPSIDIFGKYRSAADASGSKLITGIQSLNSCDIVTRPSAGGSMQRIIHSQSPSQSPPDPLFYNPFPNLIPNEGASMDTEEEKKAKAKADAEAKAKADADAKRVAEAAEAEAAEAESKAKADAKRITEAGDAAHAAHITESLKLMKEASDKAALELEQLRIERAQLVLQRRITESQLPTAVLAPIQARYAGRVFEEAQLESDLQSARTMMASLTSAGLIRGNGFERVEVGSQITEAEKIQAAFDLMLGMEPKDIDSKYAGIKGFTSIREAYSRVTGDSTVAGISANSLIGDIRVSESAPIARITEADTTTASFSYLLGTSMNKRLLKDYQAWPNEWQRLCTIVPIKDFKQQSRVRLGAFASLPIVAEDTAYAAVTLQDSAAVYVPQKRGNLVTVSREVIINDDLFAIKQIPTKLAVAAAYTLAEFVYAFFSTNPNIYDGNALFMAGAPHTNLGTTALSTAAMQLGVTAMREQTNFASKRIGLRPKYLLVPPELEFTAIVATRSAGVPGSANNDINPMMGFVQPIVSPQLTSTTQWFMVADPMVVDTIEIGFVGGQVNPALFIQDQPLFGLNFTQDSISYKIRHEYGGAVVDYRGLYRGI